jgi:hypothetical protein
MFLWLTSVSESGVSTEHQVCSAMISNEPINLCEWRSKKGRLFTCGRPGRAIFLRERARIGEDTIDLWVNGLPSADVLHIVSLLGRKKDGFSEFGYYPFRSSRESGTKPTFQEWLDRRYGRRFVVHEFPTVDSMGIPQHLLGAVTRCMLDLVEHGNTIVLIDSAGSERTARVCEAMGYERIGDQKATQPNNRMLAAAMRGRKRRG